MKQATKFIAVSAVIVLGASCTTTTVDNSVAVAPETDQIRDEQPTNEKADQWGPQDDPTIFDATLEFRIDELPTEGEVANIPWASSYWPVYQDSINYRWEGEGTQSPAEKYGEAFGVENIADKVSKHHGIDRQSSRTECETDDDCNADIAEKCARREGQEKGRCIPTWWGICHAWAPAAVMNPEPKRPVTRNGVEFQVNDIKALVTLMHDRTTSACAGRASSRTAPTTTRCGTSRCAPSGSRRWKRSPPRRPTSSWASSRPVTARRPTRAA